MKVHTHIVGIWDIVYSILCTYYDRVACPPSKDFLVFAMYETSGKHKTYSIL